MTSRAAPPAQSARSPAAALSIKGRALRYLAMREHSRAELERKLARVVPDSPEDPAAPRIREALDDLAARGLLSDARAAQAVVGAKAARLGDRRLRDDLRARGLGAPEIEAAMAGLEGSELSRAHAVWARRFGEPAVEPREQARQARFLAARGFSGDVIRRVVRGLDPEG